MSHYSSSSPARTPGLVLGGAALLGVTAAPSLPPPPLGGILLTPSLLAAAVNGTRHAIAAWETYQRLSDPRRECAATRAERTERRREEHREQQRQLVTDKRAGEPDKIQTAQRRQIRQHNSRSWF